MSKRLANARVNQSKPVRFTFDGKSYTGYEGDSLASALLANGIKLMGRSFKYHRPRGVLSAGSEEPNALVELRVGERQEPNTRATTIEIFEGLEANSQNRFPSLSFDLLSINGWLSPFLAAGFYYKTFMWPKSLWERLYEPVIRNAAGLGSVSGADDADSYERRTIHCDVLVVGSGIGGLSAALAAARMGARVIVCEKDSEFGGRLLSDPLPVDDNLRDNMLAELEGHGQVTLMKRTLLFGVYDGGTYAALERYKDHELQCGSDGVPRQILWEIIAKRSVIASGGIERPLIFGNNDLPGIMLSGAVRTYVERYGVPVGERVVVATNNDDGWQTAKLLLRRGIGVEAVIDSREAAAIGKDCIGEVLAAGVWVMMESYIVCAKGGKYGVNAVNVEGTQGNSVTLKADCVAISGGWDAAVGLACQHGGRPVWRDSLNLFMPPSDLPQGVIMAGLAAGFLSTKEVMASGHKMGIEAASACGMENVQGLKVFAKVGEEDVGSQLPVHVGGKSGKAFIDFQHDVTLSDIALAHREGYISVEHLKRYTTLGMATDQGKLSNVNGLLEMARLTGKSIGATGTTMFRSPYEPVAIGAFAGTGRGKNYRPYRLTPSNDWVLEQNAVMLESGLWLRAQWYVCAGETTWRESVDREVMAVRNGVGLCDVTTLGKIEVFGKDAAEFLNRVYANPFLKLAIGKARYGVMLREDGIVMDDGTTSRLSETHFVMTTTTANAGSVMQHLEYARQVLWGNLDVHLFSVSDTWAQFALAGPNSRKLLERLLDSKEDISNEGFPFMGAREITLKGGVRGRLFRISFSGELAYEIALPFYYGDSFVRHAMAQGKDLGIVPYGTEALGVMRIEKGHVAGSELMGTTALPDLGLGGMGSKKKDYIGRVMSEREGLNRKDRWRIVGVRALNQDEELHAGAHLFLSDQKFTSKNDLGHVTSACFSPTQDAHIGLALVRGGVQEGNVLMVCDPLRGVQGSLKVEVCSPIFYDKEGKRPRE